MLKLEGGLSPSDRTERMIADQLGISTYVVRKLCGKIRKMRSLEQDAAIFPPARLAGFMEWMETGDRSAFRL